MSVIKQRLVHQFPNRAEDVAHFLDVCGTVNLSSEQQGILCDRIVADHHIFEVFCERFKNGRVLAEHYLESLLPPRLSNRVVEPICLWRIFRARWFNY